MLIDAGEFWFDRLTLKCNLRVTQQWCNYFFSHPSSTDSRVGSEKKCFNQAPAKAKQAVDLIRSLFRSVLTSRRSEEKTHSIYAISSLDFSLPRHHTENDSISDSSQLQADRKAQKKLAAAFFFHRLGTDESEGRDVLENLK